MFYARQQRKSVNISRRWEESTCFEFHNSDDTSKKIHYPKITDDDVSKISTNIKSFVIKMKNEIKEKDKIINEYAKIINGTKKEYQKLYAEILSTEINQNNNKSMINKNMNDK